MNIGDIIVGGMLVISSYVLLHKTKGEKEKVAVRNYRKLAIAIMIFGFALMMWEPMLALAKHGG